jgi:hypothetical protein
MKNHFEYDHSQGCMYCGAGPDKPEEPRLEKCEYCHTTTGHPSWCLFSEINGLPAFKSKPEEW